MELSRFYGFPTFGLTAEQRVALEVHRPRFEAQRLLERALAGEVELQPEGWARVAETATGDAEYAQQLFDQAVRRGWAARKAAGGGS